MNTDPILIIDDDSDDKEFLQDAWKELNYPNQLIFFKNGEQVLQYLQTEKTVPFLIISEVNLPIMNGFELKEKILKHDTMRYKSIPFVFWSSQISNSQVQKAYDLGVNGVFVKESNLAELKQSLIDIVRYWIKSKVPE
jgi:CheY-like chemotaxis protein